MKKLLFILFCMIFLIGNVSALDIDDVKYYDEETTTYTLENFFGLGKHIADLELKTPHIFKVGLGYQKVAEIEIRNGEYDYEEIINGIELYNTKDDIKEFVRNIDYKYKTIIQVPEYESICNPSEYFVNGSIKDYTCIEKEVGPRDKIVWEDFTKNSLLKGEIITLGLFTNVQARDRIEWILNVYGNERLTAWAIWEGGLFNGLVTYWSFEVASGVVPSEVGGPYGLVPYNTPLYQQTGIVDYGIEFDSTDDFFNSTSTCALLDFGTTADFSVSVWMKGYRGNDYVSIIQTSEGQPNWGISTLTRASGNYSFEVATGPAADRIVVYSTGMIINLSDENWHNIIAIRNDSGTDLYLYSDGVYDNSLIGSTTKDANCDSIYISDSVWADRTIDFVDEVGVWNRTLTEEEISNLWNDGNGCGYGDETCGITAPTITLNFPVDYYNSSSAIITFNGTVYDVGGYDIINVSLYIDGVLNETNSSGINNTDYIFTKTLSEGNHNWTYEAYNNESQLTTATTRFLTIDTTPVITVLSPTNTSYATSTIFFNATNSLPVDKWIVNYNGTNITLSEINTSLTVEDGNNHHLLLYANNSATGVFGLNDSIYFSVDTTNPAVVLLAPPLIIDYHLVNTNLSVNWSANDTNIDTCILQFEGINRTVTCSDNQTQINITNLINKSIIFYVNDTFGRMNSTSRSWNYTIFENSQTFNDETFEGTIETFIANVTIEESNPITVASLIYNGTSYANSFSQSGNDTILTINFTILEVNTDTNITFYWSLLLSDSQIINLTSYNQTIIQISLDNCSVNTVVLYNYTVVDEGNQSILPPSNVTTELNLNLLDVRRENYVANFTKLYSGVNPFAVCLNKNISSSIYLVDSIVKYESIGYSIEYYNIVGSTITNTTIPINITLYDLILGDATEFRISFKGEDFIFVENALIYIDRQYISENNSFKTVELPKTDSNGQTVGHFVRNDIIYNIRVIKDGEVLGNFENMIAFCTDYTIGDCQIVLEATPSDLVTFNYNEELGIIFQSLPTYNNVTHAVSFSFSTDDGTPKTLSMKVERKDIFGNRTICNNTLTSASGTLSCSVDPNIDDTILETSIYVDNQLAVLSNVKLEASDYGNLGYVLWFFLTFLFILLFGSSKTEVLIGLFISLAGAITLGITRGDIIGIGSAGIWTLVIVILGIWKINKENPQ